MSNEEKGGSPQVVAGEVQLFGKTFQFREPVSWDVNWNAYDVPRIWFIVEDEDRESASRMVMAFNKVSQYVQVAHQDLARATTRLAQAWAGTAASAASAAAQHQLGDLIAALQRDEAAHATASGEISRVIDRLAEAKEQIKPLQQTWQELANTSDLSRVVFSVVIEAATEDANMQAREQMLGLERDLSSTRITSVTEYQPSSAPTQDQMTDGMGRESSDLQYFDGGPGSLSYQPPPPLPGVEPLMPGAAPGSAELAGIAPQPVPLTPGAPVSMVPLAPGHPQAPHGGAFVLPSRGVGGGGIVQRPGGSRADGNPAGSSGRGAGGPAAGAVGGIIGGGGTSRPTASGAATPGGAGRAGVAGPIMMGGGMGIGSAAGSEGPGSGRGRADTSWKVRQGVEPIIGAVPDRPPIKDNLNDGQQDFDTWYAGLAAPWKQ